MAYTAGTDTGTGTGTGTDTDTDTHGMDRQQQEQGQEQQEQQDLETVEWQSPEWINQFGGLRTDNVLEYVSQSPFWNRQSNNQLLKQQKQLAMLPTVDADAVRMGGAYYVLVHSDHVQLWVVQQVSRGHVVQTIVVCGAKIVLAANLCSALAQNLAAVSEAMRGVL